MIDTAVEAAITELAPLIGVRAACAATGRPQANHYLSHRQSPPPPRPQHTPKPQPRVLTPTERQSVRALLNSPDVADMAPAAIYHTLLDEGVYVASVSSMYRILREHGEVRERRRQAAHPPKVRPELVADAPNRVWSWDITKLRGAAKRESYRLYAVIDIYSRYTVAWLIADREDAALAERLLADTITKQNVDRDQLTIHADRGTSMASKTVAQMMADLGVVKSHSRPRCSNDNPFSEAQFKTLKYRPDFPDRFGSVQDARVHCRAFFTWYNTVHRHSGIGWHTPHDVHHGHADTVREVRADVLPAAYDRNPERFVRGVPQSPALPEAAWINKPEENTTQSTNP